MLLSQLLSAISGTLTCGPRAIAGYRHRIAFILRHGGDVPIEAINAEYCRKIRDSAKLTHSATTIENSIKILASLVAASGSPKPSTGKPLKRPVPDPQAVPFNDFSAAVKASSGWLRAFLALAYVTGLRRSDLQRISPATIQDCLTVGAAKTGKTHRFPIPSWCQRQFREIERFPHDPHCIYTAIQNACKSASVPYFTPQQIRRLSARTWQRVSPGLGPLILGHSLPGWSAATPYYLDPHAVLFDRICDFPPIECLLTVEERCEIQSRRERLRRTIDRLTERQAETLLTVAESMAG